MLSSRNAARCDDAISNRIHDHYVAQSSKPSVLNEIDNDNINIAIWQRSISKDLQQSVKQYLISKPNLEYKQLISVKEALTDVTELLGSTQPCALSNDIADLVKTFGGLFDLKQVSLRLTALDRTMCPRFHTDNVPCRLLTTYQGTATQWLPYSLVNYKKLGMENNGLPDDQSGLYQTNDDIRQLACGDVALLKGKLWPGKSNIALVHRSPTPINGEPRLLLALDFDL